jgi:hypothetical protein
MSVDSRESGDSVYHEPLLADAEDAVEPQEWFGGVLLIPGVKPVHFLGYLGVLFGAVSIYVFAFAAIAIVMSSESRYNVDDNSLGEIVG